MRTLRLFTVIALSAAGWACDSASPTREHQGGGSQQFGADGYGGDWAGMFVGAGRGVIGSMNVDARNAKLTIEPVQPG